MTARLVQVGGRTLALPWLPDTHELGGWAPSYAETARPGRTPLQTRSAERVRTQRIEFTVRALDLRTSITPLLTEIQALADAVPLVRVLIGSHDYGAWQIVDAGAQVTDYAADGSPSRAEVMIDLREASAAVMRIGPVKPKPVPAKGGKGKGKA